MLNDLFTGITTHISKQFY